MDKLERRKFLEIRRGDTAWNWISKAFFIHVITDECKIRKLVELSFTYQWKWQLHFNCKSSGTVVGDPPAAEEVASLKLRKR
jgi:hypothetical protein